MTGKPMTTQKYTLTEKWERNIHQSAQWVLPPVQALSCSNGRVLCRRSGSEKRRRNVKGEVVRDTESVSYDREAGQLGFKGRSRGSKKGMRATGTTCLIGLWCEYLISEIMFPADKLRVQNSVDSHEWVLELWISFTTCWLWVPQLSGQGDFGGIYTVVRQKPTVVFSKINRVQLQVDIFRFSL